MKEMKKFLLMLFVVALPLGMVACSDDDDDDNDPVSLATEAAGTYSSTYEAGSLQSGEMSVTVTKVTDKDDEVNIQIGNIEVNYPGAGAGRAENPGDGDGDGDGDENLVTVSFGRIDGVKLTGSKNNITIASQEVETVITMPFLAPDGSETDLKLSGSIKDGKLTLSAADFSTDNTALNVVLATIKTITIEPKAAAAN